MSEKTTAYWLRQFADEAERDPENWSSAFFMEQESNQWLDQWMNLSPKGLLVNAYDNPELIHRRPRRITISGPGGTFSYPEPMWEIPKNGTQYFVPLLRQVGIPFSFCWNNDTADYAHLRRGRVHLDEVAAREHAEAEIRAAGFDL